MSENTNKKLCQNELPSFLNSREGWGKMLEMKRSRYPHLHQIEPTNACPYHCIMCPRGKEMKRSVGMMDFSLFCKVIDEVSAYPESIRKKEIELFHFGESLLHPQITEMSRYLVDKGLNGVLSVNAIELQPLLSEKLINANINKIIVSLDGFDSESFLQIRGRTIDFQQAIDNILQASQFIKASNSKTQLIVRMIAMKKNADQIVPFQNFWQGRAIEAEIRPFFPWGEKEMAELGTYDKFPDYMPCTFAWQYVVVQWNGDVVACCRDYNAVNKMGTIKDATLEEIWNGANYIRFRENMISRKYENSICQPCMDLYSNR